MLDEPKVKAANESDFQAMATTGQLSQDVDVGYDSHG
jgi:hypothetical protein